MARVWKYVIISTGLIFFLQIAGIPTATDSLFQAMGIFFDAVTGNLSEFNVTLASMWDILLGDTGLLITAGIGVGAVVVSFFTRAKPENLVMLPFITTILSLFVSTGVGIMQYAIALGQGWISAIIGFILLPFTIGFLVSLVEFFRGTD